MSSIKGPLGASGITSESRYALREDLTVALVARLWEIYDEALTVHGQFDIVLAGGSTPVPVYNTLREVGLDWERMTLCVSDERWVRADDPASNEGMLHRELLPQTGAQPGFISLARDSDEIAADAARSDERLRNRQRPWDVVLLGMGGDGHTASLFPDAENIRQVLASERACEAIRPRSVPQARLTMTPLELLNAHRIILLISGKQKWDVYREAVNGPNIEELPVRCILHQSAVPVDVYWSAD